MTERASHQRVGVDQLGNHWIVFSRSGSQWAFGLGNDDVPMLRMVSPAHVDDPQNCDCVLITDWSEPNARRLIRFPTGGGE